MTSSLTNQTSAPLTRSLTLSLCLTGAVAAAVCTRPPSLLQSWTQVILRATAYLLIAAFAHSAAVWAACRFPREHQPRRASRHITPLALSVWIAIVWLPLLSLLTSEHSPWVALILPLAAAFTTFVLLLRRPAPDHDPEAPPTVPHQLLHIPHEHPLWRRLLPALLTAISLELGIAILAADHAWLAGLLFAASAAYLAQRYLSASAARRRHRSALRTSAGNSITVWTLLTLALAPFLITIGVQMAGFLGMHSVRAASRPVPTIAHRPASGYSGIILTRPPKPHEVVAPQPLSTASTPSTSHKPEVIPFDGAYWYFQAPDTRPSRTAHIVRGDPLKNRIRSTDDQPLLMEAHQFLGKPVSLACCRSLRVDVINADAIPGAITLQVLLREPAAPGHSHTLSLPGIVLPSSIVRPMPLHRAPVHESLTFPLPATERGQSFDEITLRIQPDVRRSLAAPHLSIEQFVLTP